jgi:hypothetical protein
VSVRFGNWNIKDNHSGEPIDAIHPLSARAWSLLARNRAKPLAIPGFINLSGAIEMLEGLEYHCDNIVRFSDDLAKGEKVPETHINHEAIAYINRLGQFYYFAKSDFVRVAVPDFAATIPTLCKFMVFRNKNTAHRSIDAPKPDDTDDVKIAHAKALTSRMGSIFSPKPNARPMQHPEIGVPIERNELEHRMQREFWTCNFRTFQTFDLAIGSDVNFTVELEHPTIMSEAYGVLEKVILFE